MESPFACVCGRSHSPETPAAGQSRIEFTCRCGRKYELERRGGAWAHAAGAITPEKRQPLTAFSGELKTLDDCQRYYFSHRVTGGAKMPVHIVFSPSAEKAEITMGGAKPFQMDSVRSAVEARRRWVEWFDSLGGTRRPRRRGTTADYPTPNAPEIR
jgi:hypothetical protein